MAISGDGNSHGDGHETGNAPRFVVEMGRGKNPSIYVRGRCVCVYVCQGRERGRGMGVSEGEWANVGVSRGRGRGGRKLTRNTALG